MTVRVTLVTVGEGTLPGSREPSRAQRMRRHRAQRVLCGQDDCDDGG